MNLGFLCKEQDPCVTGYKAHWPTLPRVPWYNEVYPTVTILSVYRSFICRRRSVNCTPNSNRSKQQTWSSTIDTCRNRQAISTIRECRWPRSGLRSPTRVSHRKEVEELNDFHRQPSSLAILFDAKWRSYIDWLREDIDCTLNRLDIWAFRSVKD